MSESPLQISVIIVNYNVRDFLEQCILSLKRALKDIPAEIIVVDNASIDGSVRMMKERFPEVRLIESADNLGFSAGNNLALKEARGAFVVLINPDTVVQEDTFSSLLQFFGDHPEASAATCKIINPDGSFSVDCRHSVPTPATAFWKLLGFNRLFPKSRIFGRYNLTYLDENEVNQVEAISGSFMMVRREMVNQVGLLDEDFFMYCEDIDYCHRINLAGGKIFYVPESQIIHYKGESTKKNNLDYIITFNKSLYKFFQKHYQQKYSYPFRWIILLGVILRGLIIFSRNTLKQYFPFILDSLILNAILFVSFMVRFELLRGFSLNEFFNQHIFVNLITTVTYFFASLFFGTLHRDRFSLIKTVKANLLTYTLVAASTFFIRQLAFSRLVVLFAAVLNTGLMIGWRLLFRYFSRKSSASPGHRLFSKRALIVGSEEESRNLMSKLNERLDTAINISGIVALTDSDVGRTIDGIPVVASLEHLPDFLNLRRNDLVIFTTHNISYEQIMQTMAAARHQNIEFKMVPDHLEYMVSKSNIERLESVPLVDIEYAYGNPFNRFVKRSFDVIAAGLLFLPLLPLFLVALAAGRRRISRKELDSGSHHKKSIFWSQRRGLLRFLLLLFEVLRGNLSLVGAPIDASGKRTLQFDYKPGITGILQVNSPERIQRIGADKLELHYLKNQSLWLDLEILFKTVFGIKS